MRRRARTVIGACGSRDAAHPASAHWQKAPPAPPLERSFVSLHATGVLLRSSGAHLYFSCLLRILPARLFAAAGRSTLRAATSCSPLVFKRLGKGRITEARTHTLKRVAIMRQGAHRVRGHVAASLRRHTARAEVKSAPWADRGLSTWGWCLVGCAYSRSSQPHGLSSSAPQARCRAHCSDFGFPPYDEMHSNHRPATRSTGTGTGPSPSPSPGYARRTPHAGRRPIVP